MNLEKKRFVRSLIPTCPSTKTDEQVEIVLDVRKRAERSKRDLSEKN